MPDANITDHIRLQELRLDYDNAKRNRNEAAMEQNLGEKLKWTNEIYRISAEIVKLEKRLGMRGV